MISPSIVRSLFAVFIVVLTSTCLHAQLAVGIEAPRAHFLLYERVELTVSLVNNSDQDIVLTNDGGPWIRFLITDKGGLPVGAENTATFPPLTVKAGDTQKLTINVTPLYAIRSLGTYKACAVVNLPGKGEIISPPCQIEEMDGHHIWTETRTLDGSPRDFSLIVFAQSPGKTILYLRVEEPDTNLVLANIGLGNLASGVDPEIRFDSANNLHILQCIALSTYLYTRVDVSGKVVHQGVFKTYQEIPPHLSTLEGNNVVVNGGIEQTEATRPERLSDTQNGVVPTAVATAVTPTEPLPNKPSKPVHP